MFETVRDTSLPDYGGLALRVLGGVGDAGLPPRPVWARRPSLPKGLRPLEPRFASRGLKRRAG